MRTRSSAQLPSPDPGLPTAASRVAREIAGAALRKKKNKAQNERTRLINAAVTGETPVPAEHEDPKSLKWKPTCLEPGNLRCSNFRKHARPKLLNMKERSTVTNNHPRALWVADRPCCGHCYRIFGVNGRKKMCEDREKDVGSHRLKRLRSRRRPCGRQDATCDRTEIRLPPSGAVRTEWKTPNVQGRSQVFVPPNAQGEWNCDHR